MSAATLLLMACGGGGSNPAPPPSTPTPTGPAADRYVGSWMNQVCAPSSSSGSVRSVHQVTKQSDNSITFANNAMQYTSGDCTGTGVFGNLPMQLGAITFNATEAHADIVFNRGTWTLSSGGTQKVIWVLRGNVLYELTDQEPSLFPTPASVHDYVRILDPNVLGYHKQ